MLAKDAARRDAAEVLEKYWSPDKVPVDPVAIAMKLGIDVWIADLPFEQSGYIVKHASGDAQIFLNREHAPTRRAFTCAHEIGHYWERKTVPVPADDEYSFVDYRDTSGRYNLHELYADEFAGALLMPSSRFDQLHDWGASDTAIADIFEVSPSAVDRRARSLGLRR